MGFYKALCSSLDDPETSKQQDTILKGVVAVTNLCGQSGLILSHFCRACDIMLQKKPNNFDISKMRIIKICEADANFLHSAMSIITAIEIVRQAQTGFVLVETDCKAAFDCCIPEIVKMSWLAKWVPPKTAKFVYNHQTQTTYDAQQVALCLPAHMVGKIQALAMVKGAASPLRVGLHSRIFSTAPWKNPPFMPVLFKNPVTSDTMTSNGAGFADDLSISSGSNITNNSPTNNITKLQHSTQLANDTHQASEGSFSIPKCSFRLVTTYKSSKLVDYPTTFFIQPTPTSAPEQFIQKSINEAHRTLGIHITPDLNPKRQFEILH
eukprot:CAMPEP_0196806720 /NCGR_PEP_ID=MMETSP1362-20130617/6636_1 /TAXON_ID=163516 /ORGANISM="Leptocylindrus danicus, Strain CCMP1856" /LENGTH=322 /DNA_ID=CAMNT_0042180327 /DNA_START=676 /DNA_END=1645 /DNA_ORIENTATION=-